MKRLALPLTLVAGALLLALSHLALRAIGGGDHLSAISGMPPAPSSYVLAGLYVATYLAAVVLAPVLGLAALFELTARQALK